MAEGLANENCGQVVPANGPYLSGSLKGRAMMHIRLSRLLTSVSGRRPVPPTMMDRDPVSSDLTSPWEIPLDRKLAKYLDPGPDDGAAYVPLRWSSIPQTATQALTELISLRRPGDMLVAPAGVRRAAGADVYCPTQVLAAGDHGVALWVDDLPFDRVTGVLAYRDIRMIEHTAGTEFARLTVIGATRRFSLHYRRRRRPNPGPQPEDLLMRIRLRTAGLSTGIRQYGSACCDVTAESLPLKPGVSRVALSFNVSGRSKWTPWGCVGKRPFQTAALTDHELVVLRASATGSSCGGPKDVLTVPRSYLRGLSAAGESLLVDAGATHSFALEAVFARRVVTEFSEMLSAPGALVHPDMTRGEPLMSGRDPKHNKLHRERLTLCKEVCGDGR